MSDPWTELTPLVDADTGRPLSLRERFDHAGAVLDRQNADVLDQLEADLLRDDELSDAERREILWSVGERLIKAAAAALERIADQLERDHAWMAKEWN